MNTETFLLLTQEELAEISGLNRATWSKYINGVTRPTYRTLQAIAPKFEMNIDELSTAIRMLKNNKKASNSL